MVYSARSDCAKLWETGVKKAEVLIGYSNLIPTIACEEIAGFYSTSWTICIDALGVVSNDSASRAVVLPCKWERLLRTALMGCTTGWGRIFTAGLCCISNRITRIGSDYKSKKILVSRKSVTPL